MNIAELESLAQHEQDAQQAFRCRIFCCASTPCLSSGGAAVKEAFTRALAENKLDEQVQVVSTGCMGPCSHGPVVTVRMQEQTEDSSSAQSTPDAVYEAMTPEIAQEIVETQLVQRQPVRNHLMPSDLPFFTRQRKMVLANSGVIDPEKLDDYIAAGGYRALAHVLNSMTPEECCNEVVKSGLRGRGGAGYPTGVKWNLVRKASGDGKSDKKYVVANGDEGDPGAYMDRSLMESDPHRVLEGMAIAGYAVGADQGFVYVRGEYPVAAQRLEKAIRAAERRGLLGSRIFDTAFNFRIDVRIGAGAFVCGEETALMASIMGKRGQPSPRPPYPAQRGLWDQPTLINNVETYGNIAPLIQMGADAYASIGTEKSKGTKIFALAGKVNTTGLIEVPIGITLREIVYEIGGGIPDGLAFKAAQTGGPSGGCIPAQHLDTPIDYESLKVLGSIMGSGGLIIMDERSCMVDVAKYFMDFCMDESCGKCVPCRVGTAQMFRMLDRITNGTGTTQDLALLEELCPMVRETSLCGLGQSAPNPVLSTLRYFRHEYEAHIQEHRCPAGVCQMTR